MSSTQEKTSDVVSPKTGKHLYGAAAESVKGNLQGAAAASVEGKLQGAAAEAHAQKQERDVRKYRKKSKFYILFRLAILASLH